MENTSFKGFGKLEFKAGPFEMMVGLLGAFGMCYAYGHILLQYFTSGVMMWIGLAISIFASVWCGQILHALCLHKRGASMNAAVSIGALAGILMTPFLGVLLSLIHHISTMDPNWTDYLPVLVHTLATGAFIANLRAYF